MFDKEKLEKLQAIIEECKKKRHAFIIFHGVQTTQNSRNLAFGTDGKPEKKWGYDNA